MLFKFLEIYVVVFKQQFSLFKHRYQAGLKYKSKKHWAHNISFKANNN